MHDEWAFQTPAPDPRGDSVLRNQETRGAITDVAAVKSLTRTFVVMRTTATLTTAAENRAR